MLAALVVFVLPAFAQAAGPTLPPAHQASLPNLSTEQWVNIALVVGGPLVLIGLWLGNVIRPGSLQSAGVRGVNSQPTWIWFMAALIAFVFAQASRVGVLELIRASGADLGEPQRIALVTGGYLLAGGLVCFFLAYLIDGKSGAAGLTVEPVDFPIGLGCLLMAIPVIFGSQIAAGWIYEQMTRSRPDAIGHATLKAFADDMHNPWQWVTTGCAVVLAPIFEECLYRGFLQSAMVRASGSPGVSILCTSLIFTSMHWGMIHTWYGLVPIFALSLALGVAFERVKRIGVPICMHILFNAANVALVALAR